MPWLRRAIPREQIARAWNENRAARLEMRLLVAQEQERARAGYARIVEPLQRAYEETRNPGFALLALRVLRPILPSGRRSGYSLHHAHAPSWCIAALVRAVEQAYPEALTDARRRWRESGIATRARLLDEIHGLSDQEANRLLEEWFGGDA